MPSETKHGSRSTTLLVVCCAVTAVALAVAAGFIFWPRHGGTQVPGPAPDVPMASGGQDSGDPTSETLTAQVAATVWSDFSQAKSRQDVDAFTAATCGRHIADAMQLRHASSVQDLLAAFAESELWVQPLTITDVEVVGADSSGPHTGRMNAQATITDNTQFPNQTPQRQPWHVDMAYEQGRWKMCPSSPLTQ